MSRLDTIVGGTSIDKLYRECAGRMEGYCQRIVRDNVVAQDIVHDTFETALRLHQTHYAGKASVRSWLFSIAHRKAISYARRRTKFPHTSKMPSDQYVDIEKDLENRFYLRQLKGMISEIPIKEQRVVAQMWYLEGLSDQEIGDKLGIEKGTVSSRKGRAKTVLQGLFPEHYFKRCKS